MILFVLVMYKAWKIGKTCRQEEGLTQGLCWDAFEYLALLTISLHLLNNQTSQAAAHSQQDI